MELTPVWNCRGVGNSPTQCRVRNLTSQQKLEIVALLEPMINLEKAGDIRRRLGFENM
ncbi:unnamed protein product [Spirodela intermedia]|uniref:Uncharacterized protein n=1 Tax=Spirodela intermedia TaxID=51605 RepID=A0A7I8L6D1_SPIIN|nr:unnamed protein product [Spirodela intermedia]